MISCGRQASIVRVFPGGFNEAPAVFKHAGKYYLITSGCTGWAPNTARLAVAEVDLGTVEGSGQSVCWQGCST